MDNNTIKKVVLIHDLSGFGNCSLTAGISILSAMKHQPIPLATAVLSNQTAFPSYKMQDLSENFYPFLDEWDKIDCKIDCIYSGFSPSKQSPIIAASLKEKHNALWIMDPVLGDDGCFYKCFDESFLPFYKEVISHTDFITPNLTEACLLTGENFEKVVNSQNFLESVLEIACKLNAKNTIITSAVNNNFVYNVCLFDGKHFIEKHKLCNLSYSGSGDVFASVLTGSLLKGESPEKAVKKASKFVYKAIRETIKENGTSLHGLRFQKIINKL